MKKHAFLGVLFGLLLSCTVMAISVSSTAKSSSFYLSQNDKYDIVENSGFDSVDQYIKAYNFVTDSFSGEKLDSAKIAENEIFTTAQLAGFKKQGSILVFSIAFSTSCAVAIAVCVIVWVRKQKKAEQDFSVELFSFGMSSFITSFILALAVNAAILFIPPTCLAPEQAGFSAILFSPEFFADFIKGITRFFNFLMIAPLFISYLFIKRRVKSHPNDDYLYQ